MNEFSKIDWQTINPVGAEKMKRYEKFAEEVAELIRTGVLAPGQKVPSV